jgi:SAM-dependent methyltransferase
MNRKQRRAALKQTPAGNAAAALFAEAVALQAERKFDEAARLYKRVLLLKPQHAQASNNLGVVLQAQGKLSEASTRFAQSLAAMPNLLEQFPAACATLVAVLPPLGEAIGKSVAAWPRRLPVEEMLGSAGLAAIARDPLLQCVLKAVPVRDVALERMLTALRAALLAGVEGRGSDDILGFACALARQCFINEYVFATTPQEEAQIDRLKETAARSPMQLVALAMYMPLHALPEAEALLTKSLPAALDEVLTQQIREPAAERALRPSIPRLTEIEDAVSLRVQQQYEENPYPRWLYVPGQIEPISIRRYLQRMFPAAALALQTAEGFDMLIAGCGTGRQSILLTHNLQGARVLAIDLSLASLCFAKRSTPPALASRIEYAQADILKLGSLGRSFDVIDAAGVLHHLADPMQGWRILLQLLRPNGLMHLGFYSDRGHGDVIAARAWIAERGYGATPADIRRCRQDLLNTPLASLARFNDFFATSECRDLLFHVQETRVTIPAIKSFLAEHGLRFLGFEFEATLLQRYHALFANAGWSLTDLDRWHALENEQPDLFSGMYQFWVQKG